MKIVKVISLVMFAGLVFACNAQSREEKDQATDTQVQAEKVVVYYFHMTRRCATCKAVEKVTRQAVQEMDQAHVEFIALNLEKQDGKKKAEQLDVHGQTLLVAGGDQKINLTREGFMFARSKPAKLKQVVQQKVNALL